MCFCVEYYESIFPRSLQRIPVIELAEIDGDRAELELMPVLEARTQPTLAPPSRSHHKRVRTHTHTHTHMHMHMHARAHAHAHAHAHMHDASVLTRAPGAEAKAHLRWPSQATGLHPQHAGLPPARASVHKRRRTSSSRNHPRRRCRRRPRRPRHPHCRRRRGPTVGSHGAWRRRPAGSPRTPGDGSGGGRGGRGGKGGGGGAHRGRWGADERGR